MARKLIFILLPIIAVAALLIGSRFMGRSGPERPAAGIPARPAQAAGVPVYTHRVMPRLLREEVTATGTVRAAESIELTSEITGKIVALSFHEGRPVKRGDLLVKLDDSELRAQLERAQHRVRLAAVQADRQRELLAGRGTSQQNFDAAVNEQRVLEAEANLIRAQLEKTELRAPFDGVIGLRYVSVGSFVDPSTRIATLQSLDELKVDFSISERHMARISSGAPVVIQVAGQSNPLEGQVYAIEPLIDATTRTIQIRARAENPGNILSGAFATVRLGLREIPDAMMVPTTAILPGLNQQTVFVMNGGRAESRQVQTGLRLAREVQITSGLEAGDIVITSGQLQLRPGDAVRAVERTTPAAELAVRLDS